MPAIVLGALRVLVSKVGRTAADKAWAVAVHMYKRHSFSEAIYFEAAKGGMIIQVRSKATGNRVAIDYHYIDGKGPILHYHSPLMLVHINR